MFARSSAPQQHDALFIDSSAHRLRFISACAHAHTTERRRTRANSASVAMDDRTLVGFGYFGIVALALLLLYIVIKTLAFLWRLFYPHIIGRPKDLLKLAGARWAGLFGVCRAFECFAARHSNAVCSCNRVSKRFIFD